MVEHETESDASKLIAGLRASPFGWDAVSEDALTELAAEAVVRTTAKKRALFQRGEPSAGLVVVRSGEYKLSMFSPEGREQIVFLAGEGKLVTEGLAAPGRSCRVSCFARHDASAWLLPPAALTNAAACDRAVAAAMTGARPGFWSSPASSP